jgi:A/G-specific adenine glycosylase
MRLIDWYVRSQRDLPWRHTRDPYRILVSEIMLQQTQADRVVPKYHAFLESFPTLNALADAPASEVIRAWSGLGYNRRALNLQRACRAVIEQFDGVMPSDPGELAQLPGIGPYTAGAVACFAFEADVAFVDTNIRRVIQRVVAGPELPEPAMTEREVVAAAWELVPAGQGYLWNQALMELGATVCRARMAECERCPLQNECRARPVIQAVLAANPRASRTTGERFETSSRYFRGRIVEALRSAATGLTLAELGALLNPGFSMSDADWVRAFVDGLVRDGLVEPESISAVGLREDAPSYAADGAIEARLDLRYRLPD